MEIIAEPPDRIHRFFPIETVISYIERQSEAQLPKQFRLVTPYNCHQHRKKKTSFEPARSDRETELAFVTDRLRMGIDSFAPSSSISSSGMTMFRFAIRIRSHI